MLGYEEILVVLKNDYGKELTVAVVSGGVILLAQFVFNYIKNLIAFKKYRGYIGKYYTYTASTKKS